MNRLAQEPSPYLRQHQDNPVDWYPWGEEALERARREDRPILLSVGYSACHWCHVMAHESFEDAGTAGVMNQHFVNVKVDREERPDLDQLYQGVVQLMGRGGGWPLTVFLTPDLRPFFGGTYFPPQDRYGMPGFPKLLLALADAWVNRRKEVESQGDQFRAGLLHLASYGLDGAPAEVVTADVVDASTKLAAQVDPTYGGFGGAPKFPNPMNVALLLRGHRRTGRPELKEAALHTLRRMAEGGIYDQLGGGFHRYAVDERWRVPHFEKMLYDNAQLLHLYAEAQQLAPSPLWRKVVEETVEYVRREMTSPEGGFYAAQDADSEGEEGRFFVWRPEAFDAALPAELASLAKAHFGVTEQGNFEHGQTVLEIVQSAEDLAAAQGKPLAEVERALRTARERLFQAREQRVKPGLDDKVLSGWNGLMIRALAFAARVFDRPEWAAMASRCADFVLARLWADGRLARSFQAGSPRIDGFLEDYGNCALGLATLFQTTFEPRYLEAAVDLARGAVTRFWDDERAAYLAAPRGQKNLIVPTYALHDNATPSGASTLTQAQVALAALTGDDAHFAQAAKYLRKLRDAMARNPFAYGHLWLAADDWLEGAAEVTLVGSAEELRPFHDALRRLYAPTLSLLAADPARPLPIAQKVLQGRDRVGGKAAAYVCQHFSCQAPVTDPEALIAKLKTGT